MMRRSRRFYSQSFSIISIRSYFWLSSSVVHLCPQLFHDGLAQRRLGRCHAVDEEGGDQMDVDQEVDAENEEAADQEAGEMNEEGDAQVDADQEDEEGDRRRMEPHLEVTDEPPLGAPVPHYPNWNLDMWDDDLPAGARGDGAGKNRAGGDGTGERGDGAGYWTIGLQQGETGQEKEDEEDEEDDGGRGSGLADPQEAENTGGASGSGEPQVGDEAQPVERTCQHY